MINISGPMINIEGHPSIVQTELTQAIVAIAEAAGKTPDELMSSISNAIRFKELCESGMSEADAMSIVRNVDVSKEEMEKFITGSRKIMEEGGIVIEKK